MSPLNWSEFSLSDLGLFGKLKNGYAFSSSEYQAVGIPLIKIGNLKNCGLDFNRASFLPEEFRDSYNDFLVSSNDLLIAMSGATTGKVSVVEESDLPALLNQRVGNLGPLNREIVLEEYLPYLEIQLKRELLEMAPGSAMPNISKRVIENLRITLPPIDEQRRIVAKLDSILGKLTEVKRLWEEVDHSSNRLVFSKLHQLLEKKNNQVQYIPLDQIIELHRRPVVVDMMKEYREIGVYCFGRGIFHKLPRFGYELGNKKLYWIKENDLILQITFAWEGAVALASSKEEGMYGSVRFPTFRVNELLCDARYLLMYLKSFDGIKQLGHISPGSAGRNRVLSLKRLSEVIIPVLPLEDQIWLMDRIHVQINRIEPIAIESKILLEALQPEILAKAFRGELV